MKRATVVKAALATKAVALALTLWWAACARATGKEQPVVENAIPVRLVAVQDLSYAEPVTGTGTLSTADELALSFKVGGVVASAPIQEGQIVRRGQVLATLDQREINAQLSKARVAMGKAERDLARVRNLQRDSVATLEQLQDATSVLEMARSDYNGVAFNQRFATIVAPADGVILHKAAAAGELVASGQTVLILGSTASGSVVRVGVTDRDIVRLRQGDRAEVTFTAYPEQVFHAVVSEIAAGANPATGTFAVAVRLSAPPRVASGLVGSVTIQPSATGNTLFIPLEAVTEADGDHGYVYTVQGNVAKRLPVIITSIDENRVAVAAGLNNVKTIVSAGAAYLSDGSKVKVVP